MEERTFGESDFFNGAPCSGEMAEAKPDLHGFLEGKRKVVFGALGGSSEEVLFLLGRQDQGGWCCGVDVSVGIGDPDAEQGCCFAGWELGEFECGVGGWRKTEARDLAFPEIAGVFEGGFGRCDVGDLVGGAEVSDDGTPYSNAETDLVGLAGFKGLGGAEIEHPPLSRKQIKARGGDDLAFVHQIQSKQSGYIRRSPERRIFLKVWILSVGKAGAYGRETYPDLCISWDDLPNGGKDFDIVAGAFAGLGVGSLPSVCEAKETQEAEKPDCFFAHGEKAFSERVFGEKGRPLCVLLGQRGVKEGVHDLSKACACDSDLG